MFSRRLATAAVLLACFGAACGGHGGSNVAAGAASSSSATPPAAVVVTTEATVPATTAPPTTSAPPATAAPTPASATPVVKAPAAPEPAAIEVDYQPQDGATATATIVGPNGSHVKSLNSGAAVFGGLPAGTYAITVTIDTPSGDPSIGAARQILQANSVQVGPGDRAQITCTDEGCAGAL